MTYDTNKYFKEFASIWKYVHNIIKLKWKIKIWQDGSAGKGTYPKLDNLSSILRAHMVKGEN